jgi:RNA polymerase sigma factor (sigma-70 family)
MLQHTSEAGPGFVGSFSDPSPARRPAAPESARGLGARIAAGDRLAEAELVDRYRPALRAVLRRWCQPEAEDLAQETLCVALQCLRAGHLRDPERLLPYLVGIAWNVARRARRRWRMETEARRLVCLCAGPFPLPDEAVRAGEHALMLAAALDRLAWRDREVLSSFYLKEDGKPEICRRLALSPAQFDVVKFRALRRLHRLCA